MIQGTTPSYTLGVPGYDLTDSTVYVTISQNTKKLTLKNSRLDISYDSEHDKSILAFTLTQPETLDMNEGEADVEAKWIGSDRVARGATNGKIIILRTYYDKPIEYEGV